MTYAFNLTFTRADENHAHVYTSGMNVEAASLAQAEDKLSRRNGHLTVSKVELFAAMNEDGDLTLTAAMQRKQLATVLSTLANLAPGAARGLGFQRGNELEYFIEQAQKINRATIVEEVR